MFKKRNYSDRQIMIRNTSNYQMEVNINAVIPCDGKCGKPVRLHLNLNAERISIDPGFPPPMTYPICSQHRSCCQLRGINLAVQRL